MMRSLSLVNQCVWMYLKHERSMEMLSWVSDTLGFLVLSLPHVKFTFTSVILCLVFVAYFLFYFISQSSCVFNYLLSSFCVCWHGIIWIFFAISVYGICNSVPWTTMQVQHTKGIFPLSVSTGMKLAIAISSHMKLLSACQGNPGFFLHILMKGAVLQCLII